jgi:hypothetical protein
MKETMMATKSIVRQRFMQASFPTGAWLENFRPVAKLTIYQRIMKVIITPGPTPFNLFSTHFSQRLASAGINHSIFVGISLLGRRIRSTNFGSRAGMKKITTTLLPPNLTLLTFLSARI